MQKLFSYRDEASSSDRIQSRLLILSATILIIYATIRTLAPSVRSQSDETTPPLNHWLGLLIWGLSFFLAHHQSVRKCPQRDPFILPVVALLNGIGLMTIWRLYPDLGLRQSIWIAIASLILVAGFNFHQSLDYLRKYKYIWLVSGLFLTGLTIFLGMNPTGAGPRLWLRVLGIHFQPSELLKLIIIIYLAGFFTDHLTIAQSTVESLLPNLLVTTTAILLLVFQRDLGSAIIFLLIYVALLFTTRGSKWILWLAPTLILLAGILGYFFIDVVRTRFDIWFNPFRDPSGSSYQVIQSMIAIAEGGLIGVGPGMGAPTIVPVSVSDFIYTAIGEELGFLGASAVIILLIFLVYRGIRLAIRTNNSFYRYLSLGIVFYLGIQSVLIIGGNIGLLPLTGVTLPFVSYGGSSIVVSFTAIMILINISHYTPELEHGVRKQPSRFVLTSGLIIVALVIEILATSLISFWFSISLSERGDNPRWVVDDRLRSRGDILDRNNQIIVTSINNNGNYQRWNEYPPLSPVVGYTNSIYGQAGIEASLYPYLRGIKGYPYSKGFWQDLLYNLPPPGLNVRLTIDLSLQAALDDLFTENSNGDLAGAAILMNAHTGEILALASHPYFDSNTLLENWETLSTDDRAPLVSRTTQGMYPPGSALLPFILSTQLHLLQDENHSEAFLANLDGNLNCALPLSDDPTLAEMINRGCSGAMDDLMSLSNSTDLLLLYGNLGFFENPQLYLAVADAYSTQSELEKEDLIKEEAFLISPLQMALAASALSNQGVRPAPRIVNAYEDSTSDWVTLPKLSEKVQALPTSQANSLVDTLHGSQQTHWEVTSLAMTVNEAPVTWYLAGTSTQWDGQPMVVVVVLEHDAPLIARQIGQSLLNEALQLGTINK